MSKAGEDLTKYNEARIKAEEAEEAAKAGALRSACRRPSMNTVASLKVVHLSLTVAKDGAGACSDGQQRVCQLTIQQVAR